MVKEINYPEHLHIKNEPTQKFKKKDLTYLGPNILHPSTAPNKTGKTRTLFKSKKAMELSQLKEKNAKKNFLTESLVENRQGNVFKQEDEFSRVERKIMTKQEFKRNQSTGNSVPMHRSSETGGVRSNQTSAQNIYENKRPGKRRKRPQLSINTEIEEQDVRADMRRVKTTKNSPRDNGLLFKKPKIMPDEYFHSEQSGGQALQKGNLQKSYCFGLIRKGIQWSTQARISITTK